MFRTLGRFLYRLDGSVIPQDPENRHYREYVEWLKEGNRPEQPNLKLLVNKEWLKTEVSSFILRNYPVVKQLSDLSDICYWTAFLVSKGHSDSEVFQKAFELSDNLLSEKESLNELLNFFPEEERKAWCQLVKAFARQTFLRKCKEVYEELLEGIEKASTEKDFPFRLDEDLNPVPPIDFYMPRPPKF